MLSQKQLQANRLNAQKSTGPKTENGKRSSSQNATTHGLTSQLQPLAASRINNLSQPNPTQSSVLSTQSSPSPTLPGEDDSAYQALHHALILDLHPTGILQRELVSDIAQLRWKLRRIPLIESELLLRQQTRIAAQHKTDKFFNRVPKESHPAIHPIQILASEFTRTDNPHSLLELYRLRLERSLHSALRQLRKLREEQNDLEDQPDPKQQSNLNHQTDIHDQPPTGCVTSVTLSLSNIETLSPSPCTQGEGSSNIAPSPSSTQSSVLSTQSSPHSSPRTNEPISPRNSPPNHPLPHKNEPTNPLQTDHFPIPESPHISGR